MAQDIYSTAGSFTWTCPAGVTEIDVECWGAGGGGTAGYTDKFGGSGGGGGGGGGYSKKITVSVTPTTGYTVVVGAPGAGAGLSATGGTGGDSSFDTTVCKAKGGTGASNGNNGTGGAAGSGTGDTKYSGGDGGDGNLSVGTAGGGGSSAGTGANGNNGVNAGGGNGAGGAAPTGGGAGGAGAATAVAGSAPGGGGGGREYSGGGSGAAGAAGMVIITYTVPTFERTTTGAACVQGSFERTEQGRAAVVDAFTRVLTGSYRFDGWFRTAMGGFAVAGSFERTTTGRAKVLETFTRTSTGTYRYRFSATRTTRGRAAITISLDGFKTGRARVANDAVEGYVVYVGYEEMPDFTAAPDGFSATLPVSFAVTPPLSETVELWVVTRRRNKYGLESQNTHPQKIRIDTAGDEVLGFLTTPIINDVISVEDEYFRVFMYYPGWRTDTTPADTWRVYVGVGTPPVPGVDTPVVDGSILTDQTGVRVGPYTAGGTTYYFALTVFRTEDNEESTAATFELTLPVDPVPPVPVLGAFTVDD